jgi:predicted Holliday junction resolvase-like endonuclease
MRWLWGVLTAVVIGVVIALVYRRNPVKQVKKEFEAVNAETAAKLDLQERGAVATREAIEKKYENTIREFDAKQAKKYDKLRTDAVALARWLTRVSS